MQPERLDLLAETLIDTPFPVDRLRHNAEWMLDLIRERVGKLGLIRKRHIMPLLPDSSGRWERRKEARIEQTELRLFEQQFAARTKLVAMPKRRHGDMLTLRGIDLPKHVKMTPERGKDAAWEHAQWIIHQGVARDHADAIFEEEMQNSMSLQLLERGLEDLALDPREMLADQITTAISDILFPTETTTTRPGASNSDPHLQLHP